MWAKFDCLTSEQIAGRIIKSIVATHSRIARSFSGVFPQTYHFKSHLEIVS